MPEFEDIDPAKLGSHLSPESEDEESGSFSQRYRATHPPHGQAQPPEQEPVGEICTDIILLGGLAVDSSKAQAYEQIKHFLTKSSALLTASEGVGDLMPDLWFDAVDEKLEQERAAKEDMQLHLLESESSKALLKQAVLMRMMRRLALANVAKHAGLMPHNKCVT
jgi:hypothetical protein